MMFINKLRIWAGAAVMPGMLMAASVSHGQILGELWQNQIAAANDATIANAPAGAPDAKFNPASIDYNSALTGYTPALFLNNPTFFNTSGAFNPSGDLNNTYFLFTGKTFLHAGANTFVTPHDDGFELSIPGASFDFSQPGPTSPVNTPYTVNAPSDGLYDFTLSYGECQGPPAVLGFTVNGEPVGNVPDASSTIGLLSCAVGLLGAVRWKLRE